MLNFNFQYIKNLASPGVWRRGYDYYQKEQVEKIQLCEEGIMGAVKGNFRDEYKTVLKFSENQVTANCDCPFPDEWCKHAVAVALIGISQGLWNKYWGIEEEVIKTAEEEQKDFEGHYKFLINEKSRPKTISLKLVERKSGEVVTQIEPILRVALEAQKINALNLTDKERAELFVINYLHKFAQLDKQRQHFYIYYDKLNDLMQALSQVEELRHAETNKKYIFETNPLKLILNVNLSMVGNVLVALHWKRFNPEDIIPYEEIKLFAKRVQWGVYKNTIFPIESKVGELPYFLSRSSFLDIRGGDGGKFLFEQLAKFKEGLRGELEVEEAELIQKARLEKSAPKPVISIELPDENTLRVALEFDYDGIRVPYSDTAKEAPYVCVVKGAPPPKQYSVEEFREQEAAKRKADIEAGLIDPSKEEKKLKKVIRIKMLPKDKKGKPETPSEEKTKEVQPANEEIEILEETSAQIVLNDEDFSEYETLEEDAITTGTQDEPEILEPVAVIKTVQAEPVKIPMEPPAHIPELVASVVDKVEAVQVVEEVNPLLNQSEQNILSQSNVIKKKTGPQKHAMMEEMDLMDKLFMSTPAKPKAAKVAEKTIDPEVKKPTPVEIEEPEKQAKLTVKSKKIEKEPVEKKEEPAKKRGRPPKKAKKDIDSIVSSIINPDDDPNKQEPDVEAYMSQDKIQEELKQDIIQEIKDIYWIKRDLKAEEEAYKRLQRTGLIPMQTNKLCAKDDGVIDFVGKYLSQLREEWIVESPEEIERIQLSDRPFKFRVTIDFAEKLDTFLLEVMCTVGEKEISLDDIQEILKEGKRYVYARGSGYAEIPIADMLQLTKTLNSFDAFKLNETVFRVLTYKVGLIAELIDQNLDIVLSERFQKFWDLISSFSNFEEMDLPPSIRAELREYQKQGYSWLYFLYTYGLNGILADDMGLGKTLQSLSLLQRAKDEHGPKPSLVICPTSVVFNWEEEVQKFTPDLKCLNFTGSARHSLLNKFNSNDIIITSYALLRRDIDALKKYKFRYIILDESQKIKNYQSLTANVSKQLHSSHRLALSGTPIENRLSELWSVFDFLMPNFLYDLEEFKYRYIQPIEDNANKDAERRLKKQVHPFILRRLKQNVAKDLPDKLEFTSYCELLPEQQDIYLDILDQTREEIFRKIERDGMAKSQMSILSALLRLRQICCHPRLIGSIHKSEVRNSGKFENLKGMIKEVIDQDHRILLFSQFVEMLNIIREWLIEEGIKFEYLTGSTVNRKECVDRFNNTESIPIFLISLKAGGTGLNLTGADYVIHYDPWWNPAVEDQATDRAHRIGQTKKVFVYKLITKGTVEEKMIKLQERKRDLIDSVITVDSSLGKILTYEDIKEIFTPTF